MTLNEARLAPIMTLAANAHGLQATATRTNAEPNRRLVHVLLPSVAYLGVMRSGGRRGSQNDSSAAHMPSDQGQAWSRQRPTHIHARL